MGLSPHTWSSPSPYSKGQTKVKGHTHICDHASVWPCDRALPSPGVHGASSPSHQGGESHGGLLLSQGIGARSKFACILITSNTDNLRNAHTMGILISIDCNHWIFRQTNLPHQYGVGKAGGPKSYWDGNQWGPHPVILTKMEEPKTAVSPFSGSSVWRTDGGLGWLPASISATSETLVVSIENRQGKLQSGRLLASRCQRGAFCSEPLLG